MLVLRKSWKQGSQGIHVSITDVGWPHGPISVRRLVKPGWVGWSGHEGESENRLWGMNSRTCTNKEVEKWVNRKLVRDLEA